MENYVLINEIAPYIKFTRQDWKKYRQNTPMILNEIEIQKLQGINDPISKIEIEEIYLPLSRLINLYIEATQTLYKVSTQFLNHPEPKVPYIIGVCGSVAVGKSTTSRVLKALLSTNRKVAIVNTDSFLLNNDELNKNNLMNRKGFPNTYHLNQLIQFLVDLKSGNNHLKIPVYSHYHYDIKQNEFYDIDQPDIVILEGLNILQEGGARSSQETNLYIYDFLDFTIFVEAKVNTIKEWFIKRFMLFRDLAKEDEKAFFNQFTKLSVEEALLFAQTIWTDINEANLLANILPFKDRAKLILNKGSDHSVYEIYLRKI